MLIKTFKAEVVPTHIFANTEHFHKYHRHKQDFDNHQSIFTIKHSSCFILSKNLQHGSVAQSAAPKDLVLQPQLEGQISLSRFQAATFFIVYSFFISAAFLCGNDTIFVTCKSLDCTSMYGEWNESIVSAVMYSTRPTIYIPNSHANLAHYTLGHTASVWQNMLQTFFFLALHTILCVAMNFGNFGN